MCNATGPQVRRPLLSDIPPRQALGLESEADQKRDRLHTPLGASTPKSGPLHDSWRGKSTDVLLLLLIKPRHFTVAEDEV
jgi:hypothetical protein